MSAQSAKYNPLISKLFISRGIILQILKDHRNYDTDNYEGISIHELQAMFKNKQMDMLLTGEGPLKIGENKVKLAVELELEANYRTTLKNKLQGEVNDEIKLNRVLDGIKAEAEAASPEVAVAAAAAAAATAALHVEFSKVSAVRVAVDEAQTAVDLADKELEEARLAMLAAPEGSEERRLLELEYNSKLKLSEEAHLHLDSRKDAVDVAQQELAYAEAVSVEAVTGLAAAQEEVFESTRLSNTYKEVQINLDAAHKVSDTTETELAAMLAKKNTYVDKMTKVNIPEEQNRIKRELEYARMAMHAEPKDSDKRHQLELDYYNKLFSPDKINKNNYSTEKKIYIKYHLEGKLKQTNIYEYIDDIFEVEQILSPTDELLIITKDKVNQITKDLLVNIYNNDKKVVNIYNLNDFLFNIMKHDMVPPHRILSADEKKDIYTKYYITDDKQLPEISRFDPVALAIGLKSGDLVEIIRSSPTAITTKYYRLCI